MEYKALMGTRAAFSITGFRLLTVDQLRCFVSAVITNATLVELTISELRLLSPVGKTMAKHKSDSVAAIAQLARLIRNSKLKRLVISTTDFSYGHDISPILDAFKATAIDTIEFHGCGFREDQEPVLQGLQNQQLSRDGIRVFTSWWSNISKAITPLIPSGGIIGLFGYWMNE